MPVHAEVGSAAGEAVPKSHPSVTPFRAVFAASILAAGIWSYWPTLAGLAETWSRVSDYSHGFFVAPLALIYLWLRRSSFPGLSAGSPWLSLGLLAFSVAMRHAGDAFYFMFFDGWSIVPWIAAWAALLGGWPVLRWSWPAIVFLAFMFPLPYSLELALSGPLQRMATVFSTAVLQCLGQPAFDEGNLILLGNMRLEVAQACSGLRMFVGITALTYALVAVLRRPWWEKGLLIAACAPIAVAANVARIVTTGLLYQLLPGERARDWIHDAAGWGMVLFAGAALGLLLWYLGRLFKEETVMDMSTVVRHWRA